MAVAPTGAIYKSLSFDGEDSRDYGVYITGEAVYNAPVRDVEMISIPGRNGTFALDSGRFENIEVTYPAGIFAETEADFRAAISDFRNFLCSRNGYVRLQDEYNPDEYRMAVYKSGLDVSPAQLKAGEFDITFDCKPQRFLVSGEEAVDIGTWGDTETETGSIVEIDNPDGILVIKDLTAEITPIQSGSGDPSPSNVRPISGHTDVVVSRTAINICDEVFESGTLNGANGTTVSYSGRIRSVNFIPCKGGLSYYIYGGWNVAYRVFWYDHTQTFISRTDNVRNEVVTAPSNACYFKITMEGTSYGDTYRNDISLNYPSTDTSYHAYEGDTYTTALGTTVYGGTLDVTTGVLTVDRAYATVNDFTWTYNSTYQLFWTSVSGMLRPCDLICSHYEQSVVGSLGDIPNNSIWNKSYGFASTNLVIKDTRFTDANTFKTNMSGVGFVYELATPTTTTLTAQEVELLTGTNNVWSSTGDVTVEYGQNPNILVNPTLFESSPLLEVEGHGEIDINGNVVTLDNYIEIGNISLLSSIEDSSSGGPAFTTYQITRTFDATFLNNGDALQLGDISGITQHVMMPTIKSLSGSITSTSGVTASCSSDTLSKRITISSSDLSFVYGTSKTVTGTATISVTITYTNNTTATSTITLTLIVAYDGSEEITVSINHPGFGPYQGNHNMGIKFSELTGYSTKTALSDVAYIDLDIGEAWTENSGVAVPINDAVIIPANLPTLLPGSNTITFDNTITDLKIIPRWWKV